MNLSYGDALDNKLDGVEIEENDEESSSENSQTENK